VDATLQRYVFDMRAEVLPTEAEVVTGAVLRVYKYPAYANMAGTSTGQVHQSPLVLRVLERPPDRSVIARSLRLVQEI